MRFCPPRRRPPGEEKKREGRTVWPRAIRRSAYPDSGERKKARAGGKKERKRQKAAITFSQGTKGGRGEREGTESSRDSAGSAEEEKKRKEERKKFLTNIRYVFPGREKTGRSESHVFQKKREEKQPCSMFLVRGGEERKGGKKGEVGPPTREKGALLQLSCIVADLVQGKGKRSPALSARAARGER